MGRRVIRMQKSQTIYPIDEAIDRFGIDEDVSSFTVQPSVYSDATFLYELDDDLQFQLVSIY